MVYSYIFEKLSFKMESAIREDQESGQYIFSGIINQRKVLLKVISRKNEKKVKNLEKEYIVTSKLFDDKVFGKTICLGSDDQFIWYARDYIEGKPLATYNPDPNIILYGYDSLDKGIVEDYSRILEKVVELVSSVQSKAYADGYNSYSHLLVKRWSLKLEDYGIRQIEDGLGFSLEDQLGFYNNNLRSYEGNISYCIGDLLPANIIYTVDQDVRIIDVEWLTVDNPMLDLSLLWLFLWRYPNWQSYLIGKIRNDQREDFRASVIRQTIAWMNSVYNPRSRAVDKIIARKYEEHIWRKYLKNAGKSFEELINTKVENEN